MRDRRSVHLWNSASRKRAHRASDTQRERVLPYARRTAAACNEFAMCMHRSPRAAGGGARVRYSTARVDPRRIVRGRARPINNSLQAWYIYDLI